jgi:hypothetical protein
MKELPFFKFNVSEWLLGDIALDQMVNQGLFINICAFYWSKKCTLKIDILHRRFPQYEKEIKSLIEDDFIKTEGDFIKISFLDIQMSEFISLSNARTKASKKGVEARKKKSKPNGKPNVDQVVDQTLTEIEIEKEVEIETIETVLGIYSEIKPPSQDNSRSRAKKHLVKLLKRYKPEDLIKVTKNYLDDCQYREIKVQFRKNSGNFFGTDATFEDYIDYKNPLELSPERIQELEDMGVLD